MMDHIRKNYNVDPERQFIFGFSAGSEVAGAFGSKYRSLFRGVAVGGGTPGISVKEGEKESFTILIICGDQDPVYGGCKSLYESLKKRKLDTEFYTLKGVGHTFNQEGIEWLYNKFQERLNQPDDLLRRGKKTLAAKRYLDAIGCFKEIIDGKRGEKWEKPAKQELEKIDKLAANKFEQASTKLKAKNTKEATKLLKEIVEQFEGTSVWEKAKEQLNEIENQPAQ
jgi:dienelactone hydrolase